MPSMKVEGDSDGDGDMSGGETERSGGSSRGPDRDSSAEEADEPDSDDSSEMDESECERRRNECLDNLANLERQFTQLREQLYFERVKQVDQQLDEVRGGRSQEYLGPLRRLQENMRIRIEVAGVLRQMRIENIKHKIEAEEQASHQNFKNSYDINEENTFKNYYFNNLSDDSTSDNLVIKEKSKLKRKNSDESLDNFFEIPKSKKKKLSSTVSRALGEGTAFITTNENDEENATHLIKIEVYSIQKLKKIPQQLHWKHADMRIKYYTKNSSDIFNGSQNLIYHITKEISSNENTKKYYFSNSS